MTTILSTRNNAPPNRLPTYEDAPAARDYIVALGRVYLAVGLPLASAIEAALADYQSFGTPINCGR